MELRRSAAVLATAVISLSTAAAAAPLAAVAAPAGAAGDLAGTRLGQALVLHDLSVSAERIEAWISEHPDAAAPAARWAEHRLQRTGRTEIVYGKATEGRGYCLIASHPQAGLGDDEYYVVGTGLEEPIKANLDDVADAGEGGCGAVARDAEGSGPSLDGGAAKRSVPITGIEVQQFMWDDLMHNIEVIRDYREDNGVLPNRKWVNRRLQRTGLSEALYTAPTKGAGYCTAQQNVASLGGKQPMWAGTGLGRPSVASFKGIGLTDSACGRVMREHGYGAEEYRERRKAARAALMMSLESDVKNAAVAVETWLVDNRGTRIRPTRAGEAGGPLEEVRVSEGNTVRLWGAPGKAKRQDYCLFATNPTAGLKPGQGVWYDSTNGGAAALKHRPKTGTCGTVKL